MAAQRKPEHERTTVASTRVRAVDKSLAASAVAREGRTLSDALKDRVVELADAERATLAALEG